PAPTLKVRDADLAGAGHVALRPFVVAAQVEYDGAVPDGKLNGRHVAQDLHGRICSAGAAVVMANLATAGCKPADQQREDDKSNGPSHSLSFQDCPPSVASGRTVRITRTGNGGQVGAAQQSRAGRTDRRTAQSAPACARRTGHQCLAVS